MTADKHLDLELEVTLRPSVLAKLRGIGVRERDQRKLMYERRTHMNDAVYHFAHNLRVENISLRNRES